MDFTAIDFETANRRRDSACQLAAVRVRGGQIVDSAMWMIRPDPLHFSRGNIEIHGITPDKVRGEPVFGDLWNDISRQIGDDVLVAHNASFDIGVLIACLRQSDHPVPELQFSCTRSVARRTWPHRPRFGLKPLAEWLGIRFRHHDALEDSIACAKIMLAAAIDREADSLEDLEKRLRIGRGQAGDWGYRGARAASPHRRSQSHQASITRSAAPAGSPFVYPDATRYPGANESSAEPRAGYAVATEEDVAIDLQRLLVRAEFIRPLAGKRIVFTGELKKLTRDQATALACRLGGDCGDAVDPATDLLVIGKRASQSVPSEKECSAKQLQQSGGAIRIVDEAGFLSLLIAAT